MKEKKLTKVKKVAYGELITKGAYGCIYDPSLYCDNKKHLKNIDPITGIPKYYKGKIAKYLSDVDADKELHEYKKLENIPNIKDFILGFPEKCKVGPYLTTYKSLKKKASSSNMSKTFKKININRLEDYKSFISTSTNGSKRNKNNYACDLKNLIKSSMFNSKENFEKELESKRLLIMENGGKSLKHFDNLFISSKPTRKTLQLFFLEYFRMLFGIKEMMDNNFVHYDIKCGNILYDETKNRLNFIDFGISRSMSYYDKRFKENKVYGWFNFPPELLLFEKIKSNKGNNNFFDYNILYKYYSNHLNVYKNIQNYIKKFFDINKYIEYIYNNEKYLKKSIIIKKLEHFYYTSLSQFIKTIINNIKNQTDLDNIKNYIIQKTILTHDSYSYSLVLINILNHSKIIKSLLTSEEIRDLYIIANKGTIHNIFLRSSVDNIIEDFIVFFNKYNWITPNKNTDYFKENIKYFKDIDYSNIDIISLSDKQKEKIKNMDSPPSLKNESNLSHKIKPKPKSNPKSKSKSKKLQS